MTTHTDTNIKSSFFESLTFNWVLLLLLTLVAVVLTKIGLATYDLIVLALIITIVKSQIVVDRFMGLRHIDIRWRSLMLAYIVIIPAIIMLVYYTATSA